MIRSLATSETHGKRLLFALHDDGNLRIWDLVNRSRIFIHCLGSSELSGTLPFTASTHFCKLQLIDQLRKSIGGGTYFEVFCQLLCSVMNNGDC